MERRKGSRKAPKLQTPRRERRRRQSALPGTSSPAGADTGAAPAGAGRPPRRRCPRLTGGPGSVRSPEELRALPGAAPAPATDTLAGGSCATPGAMRHGGAAGARRAGTGTGSGTGAGRPRQLPALPAAAAGGAGAQARGPPGAVGGKARAGSAAAAPGRGLGNPRSAPGPRDRDVDGHAALGMCVPGTPPVPGAGGAAHPHPGGRRVFAHRSRQHTHTRISPRSPPHSSAAPAGAGSPGPSVPAAHGGVPAAQQCPPRERPAPRRAGIQRGVCGELEGAVSAACGRGAEGGGEAGREGGRREALCYEEPRGRRVGLSPPPALVPAGAG